ncbi:hypothetical protein DFJ73DRAFT_964731 [Zopfochytrium polystomum]|nr:hypothetical protein DFJ73DRAFT_964731 [Zopfochytrium polystomum]
MSSSSSSSSPPSTRAHSPPPLPPILPRLRRRVSSDLAQLDALHAAYPWVPGSQSIRPSPETLARKRASTAALDQERQDDDDEDGDDDGAAADRRFLDRLSGDLFGAAWSAASVHYAVSHASWTRSLLRRATTSATTTTTTTTTGGTVVVPPPSPSPQLFRFLPNAYPYATPAGTQHYVLWFATAEPVADAVVDAVLAQEVARVAVEAAAAAAGKGVVVAETEAAAAAQRADYVWYVNPKMNVPEIYHVQRYPRGKAEEEEEDAEERQRRRLSFEDVEDIKWLLFVCSC